MTIKHVKAEKHIEEISQKIKIKHAHYKLPSRDEVLTHLLFFISHPGMKVHPCFIFVVFFDRDDFFSAKRVNS